MTSARKLSKIVGVKVGAKAGPKAGTKAETTSSPAEPGYLDGQMLVAMPAMDDERFARSVIYVCAHSAEGAMGIVVNQPAGTIDFPDLLVQLEIIRESDRDSPAGRCRRR